MAKARASAEVRVTKSGPAGKPVAEIIVDKNISAGDVGKLVQQVTRNKDLLRKVGLKACPSCKSGFDIWIRDRFEQVISIGG